MLYSKRWQGKNVSARHGDGYRVGGSSEAALTAEKLEMPSVLLADFKHTTLMLTWFRTTVLCSDIGNRTYYRLLKLETFKLSLVSINAPRR